MDNPMQRKNETAADSGTGRAQPMPAGPGAAEQGRHRTDDTPADSGQTVTGRAGSTGRPADESAGQRPPSPQQAESGPVPEGAKTTSTPGAPPAPGGAEATGTVPAQSAGGSAGARPGAGGTGDAARGVTLFSQEDEQRFQEKWRDAQGDFVDDPKKAVGTADELVDEVLRTLNEKFAAHKRTLEEQWNRQGEADTETLRNAMRGYRTFFQQLLQTRD